MLDLSSAIADAQTLRIGLAKGIFAVLVKHSIVQVLAVLNDNVGMEGMHILRG